MYRLSFYVPASHLDTVKDAVFAAGAGRIGHYERCSWQAEGEGQFLPVAGSDPHIGMQGELTTLVEYKVEMVCHPECIEAAVRALKTAHPYEQPAWDVVATLTEFEH
ncbi:MAG: NGG1p interacting factor NIF3 [Halieaceae bacterium]